MYQQTRNYKKKEIVSPIISECKMMYTGSSQVFSISEIL